MVAVSDPKRQSTANNYFSKKNLMPLAELGVCMGPCPKTQHILFLLANGEVLPRHASKRTHDMTIPFLWTPKAKIDLIVEPRADSDIALNTPVLAIPTAVHNTPLPDQIAHIVPPYNPYPCIPTHSNTYHCFCALPGHQCPSCTSGHSAPFHYTHRLLALLQTFTPGKAILRSSTHYFYHRESIK